MSFEPLSFTYTPPPTVASSETASASSASVPAIGAQSQAASLAASFDDLGATSIYLQEAILSFTKTVGITIDPTVHPEFDLAFRSVYPGQDPPASVPVWLYNHWLNADLGGMQVAMALGSSSAYTANPKQAADYTQLARSVERGLQANSSYQATLPLLLRGLKSDSIVFAGISTALKAYPAVSSGGVKSAYPGTAAPASPTDVGTGLNDYLGSVITSYSQTYAQTYKTLSGLSCVDAGINSVGALLISQTAAALSQISGLLSSFTGSELASTLSSLANDLSGFAFAQLATEAIGMVSMLDRFEQAITAPLSSSPGPLATLIQSAQAYSALVGLSLDSMLSEAACMAAPQPSSASFATLPGGMRQLGQVLNYATNSMSQKAINGLRQFRRVMTRRMSVTNGMLTVANVLKGVATIQALCQSISSLKGASLVSVGTSQPTLAQAVSNLSTGTGTTYLVQPDGSIAAQPPQLPSPPDRVNVVFARGGYAPVKLNA